MYGLRFETGEIEFFGQLGRFTLGIHNGRAFAYYDLSEYAACQKQGVPPGYQALIIESDIILISLY